MRKNPVPINIILLCILCAIAIFKYLANVLNNLDEKYGETIPKIVYQQNHTFNKKLYDSTLNSKHVSIYASYPENLDTSVNINHLLDSVEQAIVNNWKPYLKKDNEVIIALNINPDGSKEYKFLGNTGIYAAANAARDAILIPKLKGNNFIHRSYPLELVYKFTVSGN